jgi:hypothetical protein
MPDDITDVAIEAKKEPLPPVFEGKTPVQHDLYTHEEVSDEENQGEYPTEEDLRTLRRVPGSIPWKAYTLAFVELCERFSYYGTTVVCKTLLFSLASCRPDPPSSSPSLTLYCRNTPLRR